MRPLAVLTALALTAAPLAAQTHPDLSGTWVLSIEKSQFSGLPAPQSRTDVIDHKDPALTIARTQVTPAGEVTTNLVFAADGQPHTNALGQGEMTSVLTWEGEELVMNSTLPTAQGDVTIVDRYRLSADGKTLTQHRKLLVPGQEFEQTLVLDKK